MNDVVRVRYIFVDRTEFTDCWPLLREWFGDAKPAATMWVAGLANEEMRVEIEVVARIRAGGAKTEVGENDKKEGEEVGILL